MDVEVFEFNKGDNVSINSSTKSKPILGKIEEIQALNRTFSYTHYYRPEDTHYGRMDHHGAKEIFKTNEIKKGDLDFLEMKKIQVIKMKEYLQKKSSINENLVKEAKDPNTNNGKDAAPKEKEEEELYLVRQYYDVRTHAFTPEYNKCYCQKIVNPDDECILCDCETAYHEVCILDDATMCLYCGKQLRDEFYYNNSSKRKRNNDDLDFIPLKKVNTGYNFSNAKTYLITPKPNKTTFLSSNHQVSKLAPYIQTHEVTKSGGNTNKANSNERKEFSKINDTRYRKLLAQIEKYKQTNSSKHLVSIEKNRYTGKENIFTFLMYGFFEMQETCEGKSEITEEEKKIINFNETQTFDYIKKISIEIEATIFMEHNKNNKFKILPEYVNRFRVILANLKDDTNYELRSKIIIGQMSPQLLSKIDEKELANSQKKQERMEKEQQYLKAHILDENDKLIAKTHKGEMIIEKEEDNNISSKGGQNNQSDKDSSENKENNGILLSKSKSELANNEEEIEVSLHDPNYKIKKNMSVNLDFENENKSFDKSIEKDYAPNNKYVDQELWRSLQPFVNGKKINGFIERMKKGLPEKEANYLVDKFLKSE